MTKTTEALRNTLAVCRKYYVHPGVIEAYERGLLARRQPKVRARRGLDGVETAAFRFLVDVDARG